MRKAIDKVLIIFSKIHLISSCLRQVHGIFSSHLFPTFDHFGVLFGKKQIDVSF